MLSVNAPCFSSLISVCGSISLAPQARPAMPASAPSSQPTKKSALCGYSGADNAAKASALGSNRAALTSSARSNPSIRECRWAIRARCPAVGAGIMGTAFATRPASPSSGTLSKNANSL